MAQFYIPTKIVTGIGCFATLPEIVQAHGQKVLLVCGPGSVRRSGLLDRTLGLLNAVHLDTMVYDGAGAEPTLDMVEEARDIARRGQAQVVVGIGGGSAMDVAKATAGLYTQEGSAQEYQGGRPITSPGLPFISVPTTAGTGAEVTHNAVLTDPIKGIKLSIRSPFWFAVTAIMDPELSLTMPPAVTAASGADALCQAIECYVSLGAQPPTDGLAAEGIRLVGRSLRVAFQNGSDINARADMLYGSLLAGMSLPNSGLGGVHGIAQPLGYRYHLSHGIVCGLLLPYVMEFNVPYAPDKYGAVAQLLGLDVRGLAPLDAANEGVRAVRTLMEQIGIPSRLGAMAKREDFPEMAAAAAKSSNSRSNPKPLTPEDLVSILEKAL